MDDGHRWDPSLVTAFGVAIEHSFDAVIVTDADLEGGPSITYANAAFRRMTGYETDELIGRSPRMLQGRDTDPAVIDALRRCLHERRPFEGETINYRKDGTPYQVRWNITPVAGASGELEAFVSIQHDTTVQARDRRERDLLARALDGTSDVIVLFDRDGRFVHLNRAAEERLGYRSAELHGLPFNALRVDPEDREEPWEEALAAGRREVVAIRRGDGVTMHLERSLSPVADDAGRVTHVIAVGSDVSDRVAEEARLRHQAERDDLTGLLKRGAGTAALDALLAEAAGASRPVALFIGDVDHFKVVNDTYGHPVGDRVLVAVARALRNGVRGADVAVRWGGEEFLVALPGCDEAEARANGERLRAAVARNVDPDAGSVRLSFGVAVWRPGESRDDLVARADAALYEAKRTGRDRVVVATA